MAIDIYVLFLILIVYLICNILPLKNEKKQKIFLILSFMVLFIILAIRKPVIDMDNYFEYFRYLRTADIGSVMKFPLELLYKVLNICIAKVWYNKKFFMIVIDLITTIPIYFFVKRYSKNYLLSIMLFVIIGTYYMQFFILRQAIAISILLCSVKYIEDKKIWKFLICVIIATLFHASSILFISTYFLCNVKISSKYMYIWIFIYAILFLFGDKIVNLIYIYKNYKHIVTGEGYGKLLLYLMIFIFIIVIDKQFREDLKNKKIIIIRDKEDQLTIFYNFMFILIFFQILATKNDTIYRMGNDFCNGIIILLPNVIEKIENKKIRNIVYNITIISVILYAIVYPSVLAYKAIWMNG